MTIVAVDVYTLTLRADQVAAPAAGSPPGPHSGYLVKPPWRSIYAPGAETCLVKLTASDQTVGWGEALAPVAPGIAATVITQLMTPYLLGADPRRRTVIRHQIAESMRERGHLGGHQADALAAVDLALWDLHGRLLGQSVASLLGGPFRTEIPVYLSGLPGADLDEVADSAARVRRQGHRLVKLHLGQGVESDLAAVDAVGAAAPGLRIAVDAHWSYGLGDASRLGDALDERGCWFLEAPLAPEDRGGHRALASRLATPVAVGEAMRHRFEFADWLGARAMGIAQPDLGRTGITEAVAVATLADAHHVRVAPHHSAAFGVALAAGLQVSAAIGNLLAFEYQASLLEVANLILRTPVVEAGPGHLALPAGPGLGVEVDEQQVIDLAATHSEHRI